MTGHPLSLGQEEYWRRDRRRPGAFATMLRSFTVEGPLDVAALGRALAELPRRHPVLGARFRDTPQGPRQDFVSPAIPLPVTDLRGHTGDVVATRTREELATPFDLAAGPPLRAALLRLGDEAHELFLALHHIVADGWSLDLLLADLGACYAAIAAGESPPPAEAAAPYADYVAWQRAEVDARLPEAVAHWAPRLQDPPRPAIPGTPATAYENARTLFTLGPELRDGVARVATAERATPFLVLLTAFQAALARLAGGEEVAVASLLAGRERPEFAATVGFMANLTVYRTRLDGDPSLREVLLALRGELWDAHEHQAVPPALVAERLGAVPALHHLFGVWFNLLAGSTHDLELCGTTVRAHHPLPAFPYAKDAATWEGDDLTVTLTPTERGYDGIVDGNALRLTVADVDRVVGAFRTALTGLIDDPSRRLSELPLTFV